MSKPDLSLVGLSKRYGTTTVVDSINLDVMAGHLVSLLGPSGCGKTTTLRMVAGLVEPSGGDIVFKGKPVTSLAVHERGVGMLFQNYALFPHMTVAGNVAFGLEMRSRDRNRIRAQVNDALEMVQLGAFAERYPHELSGGQQQRVALARALVIEPAVLLLDEPFGALDKKLREDMQLQLRDIQRRLNITTIMVTHDQDEALTISDRVAVMNHGIIEQYGTPRDVYERPASRFVAAFIGTANLLDGDVVTRDGHECLVRTESGIMIALPDAASSQGRIAVSLRPESIRVSGAGGERAGEPNSTLGTIERAIYRGSAIELHLRTEGGQVLIARQRDEDGGDALRVGSVVRASWTPSAVRPIGIGPSAY